MEEDIKIWDIINEKIDQSKILRFKWRKVFGMSLTRYILKLKGKGYSAKETYSIILNHINLKKYLNIVDLTLREKMIENLRTSVCARYGENNTALKVLEESR